MKEKGNPMHSKKSKTLEKVCFICGAPHSGSTLLGLILGSHPLCFYAGEANKVKFLHSKNAHEDSKCKICGVSCPIWGDFYINDVKDLYKHLSVKTNKPIIIDSTKKIRWLDMQINNIKNEGIDSYLIYLIRDGRAVINSRLRKYKNSDPEKVMEDWVNHIKKTNKIFESFTGKTIKIQYKNLALYPQKTTQKLTQFLEIEFNPSMLEFFQHEHHPLGGNVGTQSLIIKSQQKKQKKQIDSPIQLSERNKYYYKDHPLEIKYDERWKLELDSRIIELFDDRAKEFNEKLINN
jgi:hypothetical protein